LPWFPWRPRSLPGRQRGFRSSPRCTNSIKRANIGVGGSGGVMARGHSDRRADGAKRPRRRFRLLLAAVLVLMLLLGIGFWPFSRQFASRSVGLDRSGRRHRRLDRRRQPARAGGDAARKGQRQTASHHRREPTDIQALSEEAAARRRRVPTAAQTLASRRWTRAAMPKRPQNGPARAAITA